MTRFATDNIGLPRDVRFTPESGLCGAATDVRYGLIADIAREALESATIDLGRPQPWLAKLFRLYSRVPMDRRTRTIPEAACLGRRS
jgi:hypothetical protein